MRILRPLIKSSTPLSGRAALLVSGLGALLCLLAGPAMAQDSEETAPAAPCSAPEARQFDFWIGEWDLSWGDGEKGTNVVTSILDGCVITENFDAAPSGPFKGMSVSSYDPARGIWEQTWVDNAGGFMVFTGGIGGPEGEKMVLSREAEVDGEKVLQRMTFYNIAQDSLDWDWEISKDAGASWELRWRIHYQRKM